MRDFRVLLTDHAGPVSGIFATSRPRKPLTAAAGLKRVNRRPPGRTAGTAAHLQQRTRLQRYRDDSNVPTSDVSICSKRHLCFTYLQKSMLAMIGNAQCLDWADPNTGRRLSSLANRTNEVRPRNFPSRRSRGRCPAREGETESHQCKFAGESRIALSLKRRRIFCAGRAVK
jgi:hypothetical protein